MASFLLHYWSKQSQRSTQVQGDLGPRLNGQSIRVTFEDRHLGWKVLLDNGHLWKIQNANTIITAK